MAQNCFITRNGEQKLVLTARLIGHNPSFKEPPSDEEKNRAYEICKNNPLVHSPFKTKIFPLSWAEVNYPNPWNNKPAPDSYEGNTNIYAEVGGQTIYYHEIKGFSNDYVDGGYLKYFEDNGEFDRADLFNITTNNANGGATAELREKTKYKRKAKINNKYVAYNLRSSYYGVKELLAHIDVYGNLGKGCAEWKGRENYN